MFLFPGHRVYQGYAKSGKAHVELVNLERDFYFWRLEDRPEFASDVGIYRFNDRLEHFSTEMMDERLVSLTLLCHGRQPVS